jgi:hypothetical protein
MNVADLCAVMAVLAATIGGFVAAREEQAGAVVTILCCIGGFLFGYLIALASGEFLYSVLTSKNLNFWLAEIVYLSAPLPILAVSVVGTPLLTIWVLRDTIIALPTVAVLFLTAIIGWRHWRLARARREPSEGP